MTTLRHFAEAGASVTLAKLAGVRLATLRHITAADEKVTLPKITGVLGP